MKNKETESLLNDLVNKDKLLREVKNKVALLSRAVIENPEENFGKLRDLRNLLLDETYFSVVQTRGLVLISLTEIFKDILPSYRIRLATDTERKQQTKKDLLTLRRFEESLLLGYKKYIDILSLICKGEQKKKSVKRKDNPFIKIRWHEWEKPIAIRCAADLYQSHPMFNYSDELVTMIVPYLDSENESLSRIASNSLEQSMIEDKNGDVSLRVCRLIHEYAKSRKYKVEPALIRVFLVLNIKEIHVDEAPRTLTFKEKKEKWSRKQRKMDKVTAKFNKDMEETKATTSRDARLKLNTHILREIFHIYFKVLKTKQAAHLLSCVLEGLSKFAHLIDLRFFDDLFQVLNELVEKPEIPVVDTLHCINTAVTILTGQAASMDIDPARFYTHLYRLLPRTHTCSPEIVDLIVHCMDALLVRRRRQVSTNRVLAFVKRLANAALYQFLQLLAFDPLHPFQTSENSTVLLAALLRYLRLFPRCEVLFDPESEVGGPHLPSLDDPELCNASSAVLWEVLALTNNSCPLVARLAGQISRVYDSSALTADKEDFSRMSTDQVRDSFAAASESALSAPKVASKGKDLASSRKRARLGRIYIWGLDEAKRLKIDIESLRSE